VPTSEEGNPDDSDDHSRSLESREQRYRELLVSDYTKDALNETLALLWSVVGHSVPKDRGWRSVLAFSESGRTAPKNFNREIIDRIQGLAGLVRHPALPKMPAHFSDKRPTRAAWFAERTWTYLVLQSLAVIDGQSGYFRDIQSLLFLSAVHYLLPHLEIQGLRSEHSCLVNAMYCHTVSVWHDDPAQQYYLLSVLMDYLGEREESTKWLNMSFLRTPPDDHSYLTKGQSLWLDHLAAGRRRAAEKILSLLADTAPEKYKAEIEEMQLEMKNFGKRNGA